jgi:hypothetical protein
MKKYYDQFYQILLEAALKHKPYASPRFGPRSFPKGQKEIGGNSLDFSKTKNSLYIGAVSH